ncbi:MAG: DUF5602 domain-containing protein [Ginsengibacter sp.]|jgi:hypothetical protein
MKSKFRSLFAKLYMPGIITVALMITFVSCKKTDLKRTAPSIESFAATDNANIVVPDVSSISQRKSDPSETSNTFYGPQVQMGNGHVRTWVNISHDGKPTAIGVEMTDGALSNLPQDPNDLAAATWALTLHQKAKAVTPFDHVVIDWNVHGHPPVGVYDVPHFDFHFYKISVAAQMAIPPYEVDPSGFDAPIPAGYLPPMYVRIPGGVPQMGAHWFDPTSPEWHGGGFTSTFIYGTYARHVIFDEPMITLATLQSGATIQKDIPQPQKFDPDHTYYPTQYTIWQNAANGRHYVSLGNMVWR